jgi:hypothetical protein
MPAKSPEALEKKRQRRRDRRAKPELLQLKKSDLPCYKITARRMMPRLPENISKADLRAMLTEAVRNTVAT